MKNSFNKILLITCCCLFGLQACKKDNIKNETVNGFEINWTGELNNDNKNAIREMIENMVWVEGGSFDMGAQKDSIDCPNYDTMAGPYESPVHRVTISSFYINKFELTQDVYKAVMNKTEAWSSLYGVGDKYPVYRISFNDAETFINKLNEYTGLKFCLPTEAQWEYAARGGASTTYQLFSGSDNADEVAWTNHNSSKNSIIGKLAPNTLGLYDMSGNVWEMCRDWYYDYTEEPITDPVGEEYSGHRVFRGGSWNNDMRQSRVTTRYKQGIYYSDYQTGFRLSHPVLQ